MTELALTFPGIKSGDAPVSINQGGDVGALTNSVGILGGNLIGQITNIIFFFAILLAFAYFLYGAITWVVSQGDKKQIEKARNTMIYALVGLVVMFMSFLIVNLVGNTLGASTLLLKH